MILVIIPWKNGMDLNKNALTSTNALGTDSDIFLNVTHRRSFFLETNTNLIKRGQILYDDYIKGDGMDPIGTTPDDLKLNSLGAFYTNLA